MDYSGSHDDRTLKGLTKNTYAKMTSAVPDSKSKFKKLLKVLKVK